ncbi:MAG: NAD(P)-binding oxidoreductase [Chloroflexota bacterium]
MRIAVVGATGATGRLFIQRALAGGHHLTALVRSPDKLPMYAHLTVIQGNVLNPEHVDSVMNGQDAVFCALGTGKSTTKTTIRADGTRQTVAALARRDQNPHLVILSSLGVGESRAQMRWPVRWMIPWMLRHPLADHARQEQVARRSELPCTFLRPTALTDAPSSGSPLHVSYPPERIQAQPGVSRVDVAAFALSVIESRTRLNEALTLTTA